MDKNIKFMTTLSAVLLFIFIILCVIAGAEENGDVKMVDMSTILINIACGVVPSIAVTIAMYFAFLRKIPQTTKDLIDQMLNDRLNHETANHNAILGALNPDNKGLSGEHDRLSSEHKELRQSADRTYQFLREEKLSAEHRQQLLTVEQVNIRNCVEGLSGFENAMETLQDQNVKLQGEIVKLQGQNEEFEKANRKLREQLEVNQERIRRLQRENDSIKRQTHSREDIAREEEFERY